MNAIKTQVRSLVTCLLVGGAGAILGFSLVAFTPSVAQAAKVACEPHYDWCGFECQGGSGCCYLCTFP